MQPQRLSPIHAGPLSVTEVIHAMQTYEIAHVRLGSANCLFINANATAHTNAARAHVLAQLRQSAMAARLRVDLAVLVFREAGQNRCYGDRQLVDWLKRNPLPAFNKRLTCG